MCVHVHECICVWVWLCVCMCAYMCMSACGCACIGESSILLCGAGISLQMGLEQMGCRGKEAADLCCRAADENSPGSR